MQISELAEVTGVPLPTVKFYIREGLLPKGAPVSATRAEYGEGHSDRLRVISALASVPGLPIARMREILAIIDNWDDYGVIEAMGHAVAALPPYAAPSDARRGREDGASPEGPPPPQLTYAREAVAALGLTFDPEYPATRQLDDAITAVLGAGLAWTPDTAARYGASLRQLAENEVTPVPSMTARQSIEYAVLGTTLFEPVILAIRRLLHRHFAETAVEARSQAPRATE